MFPNWEMDEARRASLYKSVDASDRAYIDAEVRSRLVQIAQRRDDLLKEKSTYMRAHPELEVLVGDYMAAVLHHKPENVCGFAGKHFAGVGRRLRKKRPARSLPCVVLAVHDRGEDWADLAQIVERLLELDPRLKLTANETAPSTLRRQREERERREDAAALAKVAADLAQLAVVEAGETGEVPAHVEDVAVEEVVLEEGKKKRASIKETAAPGPGRRKSVEVPLFELNESFFTQQTIALGAETGRWFEFSDDGRATSMDNVGSAALLEGGVALVPVAGCGRCATARKLAYRDDQRTQPHIVLLQSSKRTHHHGRAFVETDVGPKLRRVYDDVLTYDTVQEGADLALAALNLKHQRTRDVQEPQP